MAIYMKFGSVLGDVQETGHQNWIELSAVRWNVDRPVTNPAGSTAGRVLAAPRFAELIVTKAEDVATIPLVQQSLEGQPCDVRIEFARTGQGAFEVYYVIAMQQTVITSFAQESAGDRPAESLTLNYTSITFSGSQMDADGSGTSPSSYGWNVSGNAAA